MKTGKFQKNRLRRGIYILPNLITSLNIFCGFYSIIASINGDFERAAVAIVIAVIFDSLDGKIARATNTTSEFGVEYDSLSDLISFGIAPSLLAYLWILQPFGKSGWLAAFLYTICGALRLARFNTTSNSEISSDFFQGLPIPAGAGTIAATVLFIHKYSIEFNYLPSVMLLLLYCLAVLMVSSLKYYSFKKAELFKKMRFSGLVMIILVFVFVVELPQLALFMWGVFYLSLGPITTIVMHRRRKQVAINEKEVYVKE